MITEQDLQEAIAECKGVRNPNASTCLKLAAFLTIQKELYGAKEESPVMIEPKGGYSYDSGGIDSDTEFAEIANKMDQRAVLKVMDELMSTLQVVQPRIYASVLRKLREKS